jgi:excisionase family DNA binding protein
MARRTGADAPATWQELAAVTGLSEPTVKTAIRMGWLPGQKIGKLYVIPREAFNRYCAGTWVPMPKAIDPMPKQPQPTNFIRRKGAA